MSTSSDEAWKPDGPVGQMLERITEKVAVAGGFVLVAVMLIESASVIGRSLSGILPVRGIAGDSELVQIGGAVAIFAFLPFCQLRRGNVFVDFFTKGLPIRLRSLFDAAGNLLYLAFALAIAIQIGHAAVEKVSYNDTTTILRIPESWPYVICVALAWLLVITTTYTVLRSLSEVRLKTLIGPQPSGEH